MTQDPAFELWFKRATGHHPYPFQVRFACDATPPELVNVPTGLGKTAMAVLGWVWRRRFHPDDATRKATPRRLVYCLPMRVLVEQTAGEARIWIAELRKHLPNEMAQPINTHILMGGEDEEDWDIYPEHDQLIIGTQDMLLSRALNRGYAATRSRWPIQFGMLNTDCLWVFDEVQLMGTGLATTAQLEAFRQLLPNRDSDEAKTGHGCRSVWMSATLRPEWLRTVDFRKRVDGLAQLDLNKDDQENPEIKKRWAAKKPLMEASAVMEEVSGLAEEVRQAHKQGTRTIVIVNTVKRASELFKALGSSANGKPNASEPTIVLLHSRFRPEDRKRQMDQALAKIKPGEPGTIVVSTQVIEAGVDVSATTLFTELAPWSSLVQRFGRCNRRGEENEHAKVYWIGLPAKETDVEKVAAPYELDDLKSAQTQLVDLADVGLKSLPHVSLRFDHTHVIRHKDVIDLFDTTPDLAGNDIDIDRFIRDVEDSDVRVFWRDYGKTPNETAERKAQPAPRREELCPVPIGEFKKFATDKKRKGLVWRWNFLENQWEQADQDKIIPGQVYLVHTNTGGYLAERGWDLKSKERVNPIEPPQGTTQEAFDAIDPDPLSQINIWQTIAEHTDDLCQTVTSIAKALHLNKLATHALHHASRWHDRGKAHHVFQNAIDDGQVVERNRQSIMRHHRPEQWRGCRFIAKAPDMFWTRYDRLPKEGRKHFRHELASALSVLDPRHNLIPGELRDLVAYLVAAHHGKVRLSIRSLPDERRPDGNRRFARGIWDDDELPATDLGGGVTAPSVKLSLEPMELGLCEQTPFEGLPSWAERMIYLRNTLSPFHLAYLEALLRAADMRASREAKHRETGEKRAGVLDVRKGLTE